MSVKEKISQHDSEPKKIASKTGTESASEERKEKEQGEIAMGEATLAADLSLKG